MRTAPPVLSRRAMLGTAALAAAIRPARAAIRVRIGYQKFGTLVLVRQQNLLDKLGASVDWIEFPSGPPMLEALNAGAVDFGNTGDTPPIFAQAAGADLVYVGAQPILGKNQAILVRAESDIHTLADLRGRRVAFTRGSSAHNLVIQALAKAGMTPRDIQPVNLQPPDATAAFRNGSLDAWAIWDPFFAVAALDPGTRILTTAEGVAPSNNFFLASRRFADQQPSVVLALLDAINRAAEWAGGHMDEVVEILASVTGVPKEAERVAALRGVYAVQPPDAAIVARQQAIADTFAGLHIIPSRIDVAAAVWKRPGG